VARTKQVCSQGIALLLLITGSWRLAVAQAVADLRTESTTPAPAAAGGDRSSTPGMSSPIDSHASEADSDDAWGAEEVEELADSVVAALEELCASRRAFRVGEYFSVVAKDGQVHCKIDRDLRLHFRDSPVPKFVVVVQRIEVSVGFRRQGRAQSMLQVLASHFGGQANFTALQVQSVLSAKCVSLCAACGFAVDDTRNFWAPLPHVFPVRTVPH